MPIHTHVIRSIASIIRNEEHQHSLILIQGMPQVGKTTLAKEVFSDLNYVDLNDIYPRNLALSQPKDFFAVYGKRLIVDSIQNAPELLKFLPADEDRKIVLVGYLPGEVKKKILHDGTLKTYTLMPISQREYARKDPEPLGMAPVPVRISYPQPGLFDVIRNGFLPRPNLSQSISSFYEGWLARFFAQHVRDVLHAYKETLFFSFMKVLALHNMQELNHSKFAKEAGISYATAIYWTEFLLESGVLLEVPSMQLPERRQVKRSKLCYADTGLLAFLLGCASGDELYSHRSYFGILAGFTASEIFKNYAAMGQTAPLFFYRDTAHKHVDLSLKTDKGWLPIGYLSQKAVTMTETIRNVDVLIKIAGPCRDIVFVSDGTLAVESTSYPIVAATLL